MPPNLTPAPPAHENNPQGIPGIQGWLLEKGLHLTQGWALRQAVKWGAYASTASAAWLSSQGVDADHTAAIAAGISAAVFAAVEMALSFAAMKIAPKAAVVSDR